MSSKSPEAKFGRLVTKRGAAVNAPGVRALIDEVTKGRGTARVTEDNGVTLEFTAEYMGTGHDNPTRQFVTDLYKRLRDAGVLTTKIEDHQPNDSWINPD